MKGIEIKSFGNTWDGRKALCWTITNGSGAQLSLTDFGARITGICVPDRDGRMEDVVLGFDTAEEFTQKGRYFGTTVGRYANRLAGASFRLNGSVYKLYANKGTNSLHGGKSGFDDKIWKADITGEDSIRFTYESADGEEGYPGKMDVTVCYRFTDENEVEITYRAVSDKDTIINLTNHAFYNLKGHGNGSIVGHKLKLYSSFFTPVNADMVPDGSILPVKGTVMDFTGLHPIGEQIDKTDEQLRLAEGYDHNFILQKEERGSLSKAAEVVEPESGRTMTVFTDQPGIQFYSGNLMKPCTGKGGREYGKRDAFCLEAQCFPNSMEVTHFPTPVLRANDTYEQKTVYRFGICRDKEKGE